MDRQKFRHIFTLLLLVGIALIPRLIFMVTRGFEIFHSDHAVIGIMAKHILEGKFMVYYYGQGYMGSLEAFMVAFWYLLLDMNVFSLQMGPLSFFLLFLVVNYFLLKKVFGYQVSLMANLLLAISSPALTQLSFTALGGYPETLFFGSLFLLCLLMSYENPKAKTLFLTGLIGGIGLWVNNLIVMYFLALFIFLFLRSSFWKKNRLLDLFILKNFSLPKILKISAVLIHSGIFLFILWNLLSFVVGKESITIGGFDLELASPVFHVKKIKKLLLVGFLEFLILWIWIQRMDVLNFLKRFKAFFLGLAVGASPIWIFSLAGGEGHRVIHSSSTLPISDLMGRISEVFNLGLFKGIFGISVRELWVWGSAPNLIGWLTVVAILIILGAFLISKRDFLAQGITLRPADYPLHFYPIVLTVVVLVICILSSLWSDRYLLPIYFAMSLMLSLGLVVIWKRSRFMSIALLLFLLASNGYSNYHRIQSIEFNSLKREGFNKTLEYLREENIQGGYGNYGTCYVMTFLAKEELIFAPYQSPDRYPPYVEYVDGLDRVAYLHKKDDATYFHFKRIIEKKEIPHKKKWINPFWIYIIDRNISDERGVV